MSEQRTEFRQAIAVLERAKELAQQAETPEMREEAHRLAEEVARKWPHLLSSFLMSVDDADLELIATLLETMPQPYQIVRLEDNAVPSVPPERAGSEQQKLDEAETVEQLRKDAERFIAEATKLADRACYVPFMPRHRREKTLQEARINLEKARLLIDRVKAMAEPTVQTGAKRPRPETHPHKMPYSE